MPGIPAGVLVCRVPGDHKLPIIRIVHVHLPIRKMKSIFLFSTLIFYKLQVVIFKLMKKDFLIFY